MIGWVCIACFFNALLVFSEAEGLLCLIKLLGSHLTTVRVFLHVLDRFLGYKISWNMSSWRFITYYLLKIQSVMTISFGQELFLWQALI